MGVPLRADGNAERARLGVVRGVGLGANANRVASVREPPFPFDGAIVDASDSDTYVGAVTCVFSHVRQTMHVTKTTVRVVLPRMSDPADFFKLTSSNAASRRDDGPEWRWVRAGDVKDAGLSSGVVKVHALVTKPPGGEKNPKKPKKPKKPNSNSSSDAKPKPKSVVEDVRGGNAKK